MSPLKDESMSLNVTDLNSKGKTKLLVQHFRFGLVETTHITTKLHYSFPNPNTRLITQGGPVPLAGVLKCREKCLL